MMAVMVRRLLRQWEGADAQARQEGLAWYPAARREIVRMAADAGVAPATAVGVVAALSPRLQWVSNLRAAREALAGRKPSGVFTTSYNKAKAILLGCKGPLAYLSGPKVRAFYRALMGDLRAVVVDVWVARAAGWVRGLKVSGYQQVADALATAAAWVGVPVAQFQAVVWVAVRGRSA